MNAKQEKLIREALHRYTQSKGDITRLFKKELATGNSGVAAEQRQNLRMAKAGQQLSDAIRRALRKR